jgi:hypothetical protein
LKRKHYGQIAQPKTNVSIDNIVSLLGSGRLAGLLVGDGLGGCDLLSCLFLLNGLLSNLLNGYSRKKKKTQQKINVIRILGDKIAHSGGPLAKNVPVSLSTMGSWLAGAGEATGEWVVGALEPGVDFKLPGGVRGASSLHW